jgi:hypothetical protein
MCLGRKRHCVFFYCEDTTHADLFTESFDKLLKYNKNRWGHFRENSNFVSWGPFVGLIFLELESSYLPGTDLWQINSWMPDMNKIRPTVKETARRTYIHIVDNILKTTICYPGVLKMCKSFKISRSNFFTIGTLSYTIYQIQDVRGGKGNILGGHNIDLSKQKSVHVHVSYFKRFPR